MMRLHAMWMAALLAAAPAGAQVVTGSVSNATNGLPVPHASVTVSTPDGITVASTTVDHGGRFTLHLDAGGSYVIRISEPGFHERRQRFAVERGRTFTIRARLSEVVSSWDRAARDGLRPGVTQPRPTIPPRPSQGSN
jgi:hypothetical protein